MDKAYETMRNFQYKEAPRVVDIPASPQFPARTAVVRPITDQEVKDPLDPIISEGGIPVLAVDMQGMRSQLMYLFHDGILGHMTKVDNKGSVDIYYTGWVVATAWTMHVDENHKKFKGMRNWVHEKGYSEEILKGMFSGPPEEWWSFRLVRELVIAPEPQLHPIAL